MTESTKLQPEDASRSAKHSRTMVVTVVIALAAFVVLIALNMN